MDAMVIEQQQPEAGDLVRYVLPGTKDVRCAHVSTAFVGHDGRVWVWVVGIEQPAGAFRVLAADVVKGCKPV
jgi:hypothetical protein